MTPPAHDFRALAAELAALLAEETHAPWNSRVYTHLYSALRNGLPAIQAALSLAANVMDDRAMESAAMAAAHVFAPFSVSVPENRKAAAEAIRAALLPGEAKGAGE